MDYAIIAIKLPALLARRYVSRFTPKSGHVQCNSGMSALCQKRTFSFGNP